jgi:hypothetical protein
MGGKQLGFLDYELTTAKKQTKREKFLSEMEVVVGPGLIQCLSQAFLPRLLTTQVGDCQER